MTYSREFCYLNSSWISKKYYFNVYEFLEKWIHAFQAAKYGNRCFCLFPSAMLELIYRWAQAWRLHTNLYNWVKRFFGYLVYEIFLWPESWRRSLYMYLLSFPRFWTLSIERFDFYFDLFWMAWHWKPAIWYEALLDGTLTCMNKAIPLAWGPVP